MSIHFIKYMGSKTRIIGSVVRAILDLEPQGEICDLFSGSATIAGELGRDFQIKSNDIQEYSSVIAHAYLLDWYDENNPIDLQQVINAASEFYEEHYAARLHTFKYESGLSLNEFQDLDSRNLGLINQDFDNEWHLFTRYYSGTWWSAQQCGWIDSLRFAIEAHRDSSYYHSMLASLMYAMAYTSQGTGHYAQYRDAKTESSKRDIETYRLRDVLLYFRRKFTEVVDELPRAQTRHNHTITTSDYIDCLHETHNSVVYADPPYCFVHYSRFYHALETITLYDYPELQVKGGALVKGRYREGRHQSPFCIGSQVAGAFSDMFELINDNENSLVLSYSNTGMIKLDQILSLAQGCMPNHNIDVQRLDHYHMTMGRRKDRIRNVDELIITAEI